MLITLESLALASPPSLQIFTPDIGYPIAVSTLQLPTFIIDLFSLNTSASLCGSKVHSVCSVDIIVILIAKCHPPCLSHESPCTSTLDSCLPSSCGSHCLESSMLFAMDRSMNFYSQDNKEQKKILRQN